MGVIKARHRRRIRLSFFRGLRLIGVIGTVLAIAGLALQWLVPSEWVEWSAESVLSDRLRRPVELDDAALRMFPVPRVHAAALRVGGASPLPLEAQDLDLYLHPFGLLQGRAFRHVRIASVRAEPAALIDGLAGLGDIEPKRLPTVEVAAFTLRGLNDEPLGLKLTGLSAVGDAGQWGIQLGRADQSLWVRLRRAGRGFVFDADAALWSLPSRPAITLRGLTAEGRLSNRGLEVERFAARLGEGVIRATVALPHENGWQIEGSLTLDGVPFESLELWEGASFFRGGSAGTLRLHGQGESLAELVDAPVVAASLVLSDGEIAGLDLVAALNARRRGPLRGGSTAFATLSLDLERTDAGWYAGVSELRGARLNGGGSLTIEDDGALRGQWTVASADAGGAAAVPLDVAGTIDAPVLYPPATAAVDWPDADPDPEPEEEQDDTPWILDYDL